MNATANGHWFYTALPVVPEGLPATVSLTDATLVHHLKTVMRARTGMALTLVDAESGTAYAATFESANGSREIQVTLNHRLPDLAAPACRVIAAVALIKGQRWDWVLQKLTELGVAEIVPLAATRSVVDVSGKDGKLDRWRDITRQAAEQSERRTLPLLHEAISVAAWLKQPEVHALPAKLVAAERQSDAPDWMTQLPAQPTELAFAIGPEGGWHSEELAAFAEAGFVSANLGTAILRSETAALTMAAVVQHAYNR